MATGRRLTGLFDPEGLSNVFHLAIRLYVSQGRIICAQRSLSPCSPTRNKAELRTHNPGTVSTINSQRKMVKKRGRMVVGGDWDRSDSAYASYS